jgi:hypothetical protein
MKNHFTQFQAEKWGCSRVLAGDFRVYSDAGGRECDGMQVTTVAGQSAIIMRQVLV